jgi:hypothetical protein
MTRGKTGKEHNRVLGNYLPDAEPDILAWTYPCRCPPHLIASSRNLLFQLIGCLGILRDTADEHIPFWLARFVHDLQDTYYGQP